MFYAYVIKSITKDYLYKGHCENLEKRILEHNSGMTTSIKPYIPFELIYFEQFHLRIDAVKREKYFKTSAGRKFLKNKIISQHNARPAERCSDGDSIRASEAPDPSSILGEATIKFLYVLCLCYKKYY